MLVLLIALTVADLQPLPEDQQAHLSPQGFASSVQSCVDTLDASELYCGCVVRGFQMFLPRKDWEHIKTGLGPSSLGIVEQVVTACQTATLRD